MAQFTAHVDRFEGEKAVLIIEKDAVSLPRTYLPQGSVEGETLTLSLRRAEDASLAGKQQAKEILNEILKGDQT